MILEKRQITPIVQNALSEDVGYGDITTNSIVPKESTAKAVILTKEPGVIAGLEVAKTAFELIDPLLQMKTLVPEGEKLASGQVVMEIEGSARSILTAERVALNFLQRMSGIATKTLQFVEMIRYYNAKIVDTRKTTPGLRILEKYAVTVGGGRNHRFGLFDAVLIKDNHIAVAGGVREAIVAVRHKIPHTTRVEVEVEALEQIDEALEVKADIIMLDNMSTEQMHQAVEKIAGRAVVEASGGITEETLVEIAKTGVDYISVGALTHTIRSLDISLDIQLPVE
ncbi:carboxylating nicotinate-nucleotide diphosphorylase [Fodinisporobacter ferrooxydans]|uniref:nicotinate-nucleotide diphosphorylase (carboxylating) n=1 Tax=Fodinisporobacter ferrooxydans TaxID=2901836 RepID=A0ABY4CND2_9BACL|nr:carboxylating nicotinate-nucleotide diphosphorylase [Alicyclobacillaceae bacterium MYW30-H2]